MIAAPLQLKTLGQESENVFQLKVTNNTGKDITFFSVDFYDPDPAAYNTVYQMQEALINAGFLEGEADGSVGPMTQAAIEEYREANGLSAEGGADKEMLEKLLGSGYDGNLLENGDVFAIGETRILFVPKTRPEKETAPAADGEVTAESTEEAEETGEPEKQNDALTEAFQGFSIVPEYVVSFCGQGEDTAYYLFAFPAGRMQTAQLNLDGTIPYMMYTMPGSPELISTLDAEKAASDIVFGSGLAAAPVDKSDDSNDTGYDTNNDTGYDTSYDTGYDTGYDDSYDTSYVEPETEAEPEPVYEAPYVVTEEYYPSCDDGSHGVIYRVWSDGTEERIDY